MFRRATLLLIPALLLTLAVPAFAAAPGEAATDPAKAGPDFKVQGEYVATLERDGNELKIGLQVIALGDGKFRAVGYMGGLPGDGWDQEKSPESAESTMVDGAITFTSPDGQATATVKDGVIEGKGSDGRAYITFKKVDRKSPTLGAKPPEGAVVLFDGTTPDNFKGGRMTKDGLLMEGITSKQTFQSFTLHVEFCTPFMPKARGQGRGNSGFYAQGRYEVQILDSFGLEGLDNECGGIYKIGKPKVNMCLPPLAWQTYDADFTAAEYKDGKKVKDATMTVRHNGVLIHENLKLGHATTAAPVKEGPEPGPIYFQNHGNPVRFRNIWIVPKK